MGSWSGERLVIPDRRDARDIAELLDRRPDLGPVRGQVLVELQPARGRERVQGELVAGLGLRVDELENGRFRLPDALELVPLVVEEEDELAGEERRAPAAAGAGAAGAGSAGAASVRAEAGAARTCLSKSEIVWIFPLS